jgi:septal ring factor EnvC (AmiA/AmiB activator)
MAIPRLLFIAGVVLLLVRVPYAQGQEEIKKKQTQLQKLKKEIDGYEKKIKEREKKEHATLDLLDTYDRQVAALRKLIRKLHDDEESLQHDIEATHRTISGLNDKLSFLKNHYARYVAAVYKHGNTYDLELLLSSQSLNQLFIRSEYLRQFSAQRKRDIDHIGVQRDEYEEQNDLLQRQLAEQHDLIAEKAKEEASLVLKTKKRKSLLTEIRRDKKNYQKEINRKLEAAKQMEQLISKLIEEDRIKKEREAARAKKEDKNSLPPRETITGGAFDTKRGRLRWPVAGGKIIARFGNQQNPTLHTITQNPGIDIAIAAGTSVEAVTDGEVSAIWWLPSFGNLVILNHKNGFRTVYAHLSDISVNEGDIVHEGERIGKSGEALSGPVLHFEVWKERDKQDPEQWLRPNGVNQK